ncbi:MAG: FtsX-like permease family protein [Alphaproteobacteria bacterium]|nr:FtsX-like permease family protein [Alphaproteobacteria bacterium]
MTAASGTVRNPLRQASSPGRIPLALRLAGRQMRGGIEGFVVFMLCVALGVMVIAAIGALANALVAGLERQGRQIIGGDIALSRMHTPATQAERSKLDAVGTISETSTMRVMARTLNGDDQILASLKSVDRNYPLVGKLELRDGAAKNASLAGASAAVEPILLERLGIKVGDQFQLGSIPVTARAIIDKQPDGLLDRLTYGPRILVSTDTLKKTGLAAPGALIRWRYAIGLHETDPSGSSAQALDHARAELKQGLAKGGFIVVDRTDPSPQIRRTLERLRQFLTLIGLTALIVGGVGIANAVANFVDRRRRTIATMKSVGAKNRTILAVFMTQILVVTLMGIAIGLVAGVSIPAILANVFGDSLPISPVISISASNLLAAAGYGLLVALLFSLWPLGRAELISPAVLFRDQVGQARVVPRWPIIVATVVIAILLASLAIFSSDTPHIAAYFAGALVLILLVFYGLGHLVTFVARRLPRPKMPELAIALGSIAAPGGLARTVVLSLGAGLSMLVAVALTDASLVSELTGKLPQNAPDYFLLDIPKGEADGFKALVAEKIKGVKIQEAPMLRGRLVALAGKKTEDVKPPVDAEWVLRGDRGITYAKSVPPGSKIVEGKWWEENYSGTPLVSFEVDLARMLGLGIGDEITVNVLGRDITAKIANLRQLDWDSLSINFVMVFSPNTLQGAPSNQLATINLPEDIDLPTEAAAMRAISKAYPTVTSIRVRDAVDSFNKVFARIMTAIRVAGGVTLLAGALVLAGALATAQRRRILEAVILKALGATRRRILTAHAIEYLLLAALTAVFAILLGGLASWIALSQVLDIPFVFSWFAIAQALLLSIALVVVFGGLGTWQVLQARPVPYLKSE